MTFGVKFSASEVDDAFAEMKIDEGMIDAAHLKGLMVSKETSLRCFLIKASRTELSGSHTKKNLHLTILLLGSPSLCVGTHIHSVKNHHRHHQSEILHWDQCRFIESRQQIWKPKSEIQQYKSKPSSLEIALKLRKMPSLKLNYSSSAFSRALLHNKKVRTRYFGDETSKIKLLGFWALSCPDWRTIWKS